MAQPGFFPQTVLEDWQTEEAYARVFNDHWKKLYTSAYLRLRDEELAKDMVQDLFVNVWQRRHTIQITESMEAYLCRSLQYQLIAHFRKENIRSKAFAYLLEKMAEVEERISDRLTEQDLEKTVSAELKQMPDTMREIFNLRIRDYTVAEIAKSLNLAEKTVRNNISKGLSRIRKAISRDFPEDFSAICLALYIILT